MIFGNTRVDVLRSTDGGAENGMGDPTETDDVAVSNLSVDVQRATIRRLDPTSGKMLTLDGFEVQSRLSTGFVFQPTDRLKDLRTGEVLQVETVDAVRTPAGRRTLLSCTMVS